MSKWSTRFVLSFISVFMAITDSLASIKEDPILERSTSYSFHFEDDPLDDDGVDPAFYNEALMNQWLFNNSSNAREQESPVVAKKAIKRERVASDVEEIKLPTSMRRPEIHYHILAGFSDLQTGQSASIIIEKLRNAAHVTRQTKDTALRNHYLKLQKNQGWLSRTDDDYYITVKGLKARESLGRRYGLSVHTQRHKKLRVTEARDQADEDENLLDTSLREPTSSQAFLEDVSSSISSDSSSGGSSEHIKVPTRIRILVGNRTTLFEPSTGRSVTTYNTPPSNKPQNFAELPPSMKFIIMNISQKLFLPQLLSNEAFIAELKHDLINGLRFGLAQTLKGVGIINADHALEAMIGKQVEISISQNFENPGDQIE